MEQVIYTILIPLAVGLIIALLTDEINEGINRITRFLVLSGARHVSERCRARYTEECLADLNEIKGPFSKLWNAIGMHRAARSNLYFPGNAGEFTADKFAKSGGSASEPADSRAVAEYSAEMLSELRDLAQGAGHSFTAHLIGVAVKEARFQADSKSADDRAEFTKNSDLQLHFAFDSEERGGSK